MTSRFSIGTLFRTIERRTGLTSLGIALLVAGIGTIALGRSLGNPGLAVIGLFLLLAIAGIWLVSARRPSIKATRDGLPPRVQSGRLVEGGFELTSSRRIRSIVVVEHYPVELRDDIRVPVSKLAPNTVKEHRYTFQAHNRGVFEIGPLEVISGDPFGIVRRHTQVAGTTELIVHPRVDKVIDRISARRWEDPAIRPPRSLPWPTGSELYGMSEYQTGDDPRRIVWSAVARTGEYYVREAEQGITDRVTVVLDTDAENYETDLVSPSFEAAIRSAAAVGSSHLIDGFSLGVVTNSGTIFEPVRGRHHRTELLDCLAGVEREPHTLRKSIDRLIADRTSDGHFVIITSRIDTGTAMALRVFADHGRSLLIVLTVNDRTDAATWRHASALRCGVVEVYGAEPLGTPFMNALGLTRT